MKMPINKIWMADNLHDTDHQFVLALLLLYQKLRGLEHYVLVLPYTRYSELSVH